jgi:hypothetical protein
MQTSGGVGIQPTVPTKPCRCGTCDVSQKITHLKHFHATAEAAAMPVAACTALGHTSRVRRPFLVVLGYLVIHKKYPSTASSLSSSCQGVTTVQVQMFMDVLLSLDVLVYTMNNQFQKHTSPLPFMCNDQRVSKNKSFEILRLSGVMYMKIPLASRA